MEPTQTTFVIGGDSLDFKMLPPLTIGDKKRMKSDPDYGVDFSGVRDLNAENEAKLVLFLCRKLRPATTMAEVDALPMIVGQRILAIAVKNSTEIDAGFSTPSTSSPAATAGGPTK